VDRVQPHGGLGQPGGGHADRVEDGRRHLVAGGAEQGGRIGQEGDAAEEQQVEQDQQQVEALDVAEQRVVGDPEHPDRGRS